MITAYTAQSKQHTVVEECLRRTHSKKLNIHFLGPHLISLFEIQMNEISVSD